MFPKVKKILIIYCFYVDSLNMSFLIRILVKCILLCNLLYTGTVISFFYHHILYFDIPFKFFSRIYFLKNFSRKCHGQEARWELPVLEVYWWSRLTGGPCPAVTHLCISSYWGYSWGVCTRLTSYLPTQFFSPRFYFCVLNEACPNHLGSFVKSPNLSCHPVVSKWPGKRSRYVYFKMLPIDSDTPSQWRAWV